MPVNSRRSIGRKPENAAYGHRHHGPLFETLCVRDLRTYAQVINGEVFHYHDETGREADAVVQLRDGRYALFEMKLGTALVDDGAKPPAPQRQNRHHGHGRAGGLCRKYPRRIRDEARRRRTRSTDNMPNSVKPCRLSSKRAEPDGHFANFFAGEIHFRVLLRNSFQRQHCRPAR